MSISKPAAALFIAFACFALPGCHQHTPQGPAARSAQTQTDDEREYQKFREQVERTKKRVLSPGHPGHPNQKP